MSPKHTERFRTDPEEVKNQIRNLQDKLNQLLESRQPSKPEGDYVDDLKRTNKEISDLQRSL